MDDKLKIVDLAARREGQEETEHEEWKKEMLSLIDDLKKAIEKGSLTQIVMQWEEEVDEDEREEYGKHRTMLSHWNRGEDMDQTLGYATRLSSRLFLIAEGLVG